MTIAVVCGAAAICYLVHLFTRVILALRYQQRLNETEHCDEPVTVLQPILSGDPDLQELLQRNLHTATAQTQFLWLIDHDDPVAQQIAADIIQSVESSATAAQPRIQVYLCDPCPPDCNPKVWKLLAATDFITTPFLAVLDDDTQLQPEHLQRAIALLRHAELYTGLPCYDSNGNLWSNFLAHFVNNNSILTYLPLLNFRPPLTINGMFYVLRQSTLREYGGFAAILHELCDDYAMARLVQRHGGTILQGHTSQRLRTMLADGRRYLIQMHRWFVFARLLIHDQSLRTRLVLGFWLGLPPLLLWLSLGLLCGGIAGAIGLALLLVLRFSLLRFVQRRFFHPPPMFRLIPSTISELLQPFHFLHATWSSEIRWRKRRIRVSSDSSWRYLDHSSAPLQTAEETR
ncbi:MAG: glycosyltransferase [Planctomycetaceae bacterium]|nr:glycosyltransferase [Planctomycetaceae bacterium]